ncbi:DNA polymerase III subunit alpha [Staphylococcus sp. SQ8-PEA]|uniref:DNA polymerase III subunit alpha n=1 Tax=Staphylococcus marylandisciuri TaxID=2981529 RepID=A0ABT2QQ48_9STAP|nr:DNA polymerase III subunit alpha [Staphylococcus marylandisciuri]MCU5746103.1 DNA polymerase III subunit alpha [Staphylococcus marylandisciuri]
MQAHLNIHTSYDLLNSSIRIKEVVSKAVKEGYQALAITDTNVLYGYPQFYDACIEAGIHPIFGMTTYLTDGLTSVETLILAKNNSGLQLLYELSTNLQLEDLTEMPISWVSSQTQDLALILKNLNSNNETILKHFTQLDGIYQNHESSASYQIPKVWAQSACYLNKEDVDTIPALHAIRDNQKLDLVNDVQDLDQYFYSRNEIQQLNIDDMIWKNTEQIVAECQAELHYHQSLLPKFQTPDQISSKHYLWQLLQKGLKKKNLDNPQYLERLEHEYQVITEMGFEDYFLIVSDLIYFAKTHDVMVGPGRGSAAGSLVSYLLDITTIDPLKYNLLFERFLNPERVTMPDIDIDFEDSKRDRVIEYVQEKYGSSHVAGIVTFGHLQARAVARDVGRIMGFDEVTLNEISSLIPHKLGITLNQAYDNKKFQEFVRRNYRHEKWFEISKKLEGLPRHTSTHAAGIIINNHPLVRYVPLTVGDNGLLTQWTMTEDERLGLLKIDFLGLRNLSIIQNIIKQVAYHQKEQIDVESIPFDDPKVFSLLSSGNTTGIFQLESEGIRDVLQRLKPQHFEDIVAVTSLYRPGPMEEIPTYITRRHDPSQVQYLHPDLEPILHNTYGVIIYQEQIMQIANKFAGFNFGEADILRRAMSKKNRAVLESERHHFIEGSVERGYSAEVSKKIFDLILKFANYGFARAHAVSYSKIAYIMAYLKVHYPNYFYANILTNSIGSEQKTKMIVDEAKQQNITILPPNINESFWFYRPTKKAIYLSLGTVKRVGYQSVKVIVEERKKNGPYKDFMDFTRRLPKRVKTVSLLEALVLVGAFDHLGHTRATLLSTIDRVMDDVSDVEQDGFIFKTLTPKEEYEEKKELPDQLLSKYEKDYLGFYITKHPMEKLFDQKQYLGIYQLGKALNHQPILIQIEDIKRIRTKNGQNMAFTSLNDGIKTVDGVIFPNVYKRNELDLKIDNILIVYGKFEERRNKLQLIVNKCETLDQFEQQKLNSLNYIVVRKHLTDETKQFLIDPHMSEYKVMIYYYDANQKQLVPEGHIKYATDVINSFIEQFSPRDIRII